LGFWRAEYTHLIFGGRVHIIQAQKYTVFRLPTRVSAGCFGPQVGIRITSLIET
jgi:hypothetical protein